LTKKDVIWKCPLPNLKNKKKINIEGKKKENKTKQNKKKTIPQLAVNKNGR
jgi:hypothetical protein